MFNPLRDRARGHWHTILASVGINPGHLKKGAPCPLCGGRDRFHFYNSNDDGTWFCRGCGQGSGADLVMRFLGLEFRDAAKRIEQYIGAEQIVRPAKPAANSRSKLRRMWKRSKPVARGDVVDSYLQSRHIGLDQYPNCLRTAPWLCYFDDDEASAWPAMLAMVHDITGQAVTIHRTYLAKDGSGKAPVEKPRKTVCAHGTNPHIRLTPVATAMGIAEGIETALAVAKLFSVPTWSALSTYGIETFEPPSGIERLIVFGDHDSNGAGQKAAHTLAARLASQMPVEVRIPDRVGDWNDVLLETVS